MISVICFLIATCSKEMKTEMNTKNSWDTVVPCCTFILLTITIHHFIFFSFFIFSITLPVERISSRFKLWRRGYCTDIENKPRNQIWNTYKAHAQYI